MKQVEVVVAGFPTGVENIGEGGGSSKFDGGAYVNTWESRVGLKCC